MRSLRLTALTALIIAAALSSPVARADGGRGDDGTPGRPPGTKVVDCGCDTLNDVLHDVRPGDTVLIKGTCSESVIFNSPTGQFDGVTLDGQGTATVSGPDPTLNVLELDGVKNFTVRGLTVTGGRDGIAIDTGTLVAIDTVTVNATGRHGVHYQRMSSGYVVNSTISNNPQNGLIANENSYVRIGFTNGVGASEGDTGPNVITGNGGFGIRVQRQSGIRAYTNTVSNNLGDGVHVESDSYAEVATNVIDNNGKSGVFVSENSVLHLGNPTGTKNEDNPNTTNVPNGTYGLTAQWGAYAQGRLGTLRGATDGASFTHGANNNLTP